MRKDWPSSPLTRPCWDSLMTVPNQPNIMHAIKTSPEYKMGAAHELGAGESGAPVLLDVRDHLLVSREMATWISMIRVRQIATKHWALLPVRQLSDAVWTTEHAPVEVYTHDNYVLDLALLKERQQLLPIIRHGVGR